MKTLFNVLVLSALTVPTMAQTQTCQSLAGDYTCSTPEGPSSVSLLFNEKSMAFIADGEVVLTLIVDGTPRKYESDDVFTSTCSADGVISIKSEFPGYKPQSITFAPADKKGMILTFSKNADSESKDLILQCDRK